MNKYMQIIALSSIFMIAKTAEFSEAVCYAQSYLQKNKELTSNLFKAIYEGNLDEVKMLIPQPTGVIVHADINAKDEKGRTPLYLAIKKENFDIVKYLVENGADVNAETNDGTRPLNKAKSCNDHGNLEIVKYLLEHGATVDANSYSMNPKEQELRVTELEEAIKKDDISSLNIDIKDINNFGLLHIACFHNKLDIVKYFISKGADINAKLYEDESTPIIAASYYGYLDIVKYLVDNGTDINAENIKWGSPLYLASKKGHLETVKYLIEKGANINAKNKDGITALDIATKRDHSDIVKYLNAIKSLAKYGFIS